jgi:hypothetical protein
MEGSPTACFVLPPTPKFPEATTYTYSARHRPYVEAHKWRRAGDGHADTKIDGKKVKLQKFILCNLMGATVPPGKRIWNKNNDRRDCTDENLVITDPGTITRNSVAKSQYDGVSTDSGKWRAFGHIPGTSTYVHIGNFDLKEDAAVARDRWLMGFPGSDGFRLNFEHRREEFKANPLILSPKTKKRYVGVKQRNGRYRGVVNVNKERIFAEHMRDDEVSAAKDHDQLIVNLNLRGYPLNFPEDYPDYDTRKILVHIVEDEGAIVHVAFGKNGHNIIVDRDIYETYKYNSWGLKKVRDKTYVTLKTDGKMRDLHRLVCGVTDGKVIIDHVDGNTLHNARRNLRAGTNQQNVQNQKKREGTSEYVHNVSYCSDRDKWVVHIVFPFYHEFPSERVSRRFDEEHQAGRYRDLLVLAARDQGRDVRFQMNFHDWDADTREYWMSLLWDKEETKGTKREKIEPEGKQIKLEQFFKRAKKD